MPQLALPQNQTLAVRLKCRQNLKVAEKGDLVVAGGATLDTGYLGIGTSRDQGNVSLIVKDPGTRLRAKYAEFGTIAHDSDAHFRLSDGAVMELDGPATDPVYGIAWLPDLLLFNFFGDGNVEFEVTGFGTRLISQQGILSGAADLKVAAGAVIENSSNASLLGQRSVSGNWDVDGDTTLWTNRGIVTIGGRLWHEFNDFEENIRIESIAPGVLSIRNGSTFAAGSYHGFEGTYVLDKGKIELDQGTLISPRVSNGGLVVNNGLIQGDFHNQQGGVLKGSGEIQGDLILEAGSILAPGTSPGTLTAESSLWTGGAAFEFEINRAKGGAGEEIGWDLLFLSGSVDIQASDSSPFTLRLVSLTSENEEGEVFDFNPLRTQDWMFAYAADGIHGFDPDAFVIDTSRFANGLEGGSFSIHHSGDSLVLRFTAVPEASSMLLASFACLAGILLRRRGNHPEELRA